MNGENLCQILIYCKETLFKRGASRRGDCAVIEGGKTAGTVFNHPIANNGISGIDSYNLHGILPTYITDFIPAAAAP